MLIWIRSGWIFIYRWAQVMNFRCVSFAVWNNTTVKLKVEQKHPVLEGRGFVHAWFEALRTEVKVFAWNLPMKNQFFCFHAYRFLIGYSGILSFRQSFRLIWHLCMCVHVCSCLSLPVFKQVGRLFRLLPL